MCLVLDACVFGDLLNRDSKSHENFKPVFDWITKGSGKLVYGGRKYKSEMRKSPKIITFFSEIQRAGKVVQLSDSNVNKLQRLVSEMEPDKKFDDPHLIAIVLESKCKIICTNETRAIPYLKDAKFYKGHTKKPKIYKTKRNSKILNNQNIANICKSCT